MTEAELIAECEASLRAWKTAQEIKGTPPHIITTVMELLLDEGEEIEWEIYPSNSARVIHFQPR